jgi:hypothetical protein
VYACGEVVDMTGSTVVNNSRFPQPAQVVLRCFIEQTGGYGVRRTFSHDYILYETVIPEHQSVVITNNKDFNQVRIPAVPPTWSGEYLDEQQTQRKQACVRWAYTLEIRLTEWGGGFSSRTPILVAATPPYAQKLQDFRHAKADPVVTDQWSIYQYAVFGPKENGMAPTLSHANNRGRLKLVQCEEPVWTGPLGGKETWMKDDQKLYNKWMEEGVWDSQLEYYFHRPVVNSYTGPSIYESKTDQSDSTGATAFIDD